MPNHIGDPVEAVPDPSLPFLAHALDKRIAASHLQAALDRRISRVSRVDVCALRVLRHKPGRRCLIEYELLVEDDNGAVESLTVLGKIRSKGLDLRSYQVQRALFERGFGPDSRDGIQVPEPVGTIPAFQMWLQRKVDGQTASTVLDGPDGPALARRLSDAAQKVHAASVVTTRTHTIADELRILKDRLAQGSRAQPGLTRRIERVQQECERLAAGLPEPSCCGIHRDYYADQVIVNGPNLYVVDFDLYCRGDPSLDIGNAIAHITEQSLRTTGDTEALADCERAIEERFVESFGETVRAAVRGYTILTLARHIALSMHLPGRCHTTRALLALCEGKL